MTASDLLKTLEAEGVGVSLNLKLEADAKPSDDTLTLIREHRDALLEHLIAGANYKHANNLSRRRDNLPMSANFQRAANLHLYGDLLHSLMAWVARHYELRLEHPGGVILNAKPEQAVQHLTCSAWALLYDETQTILATAGNVPHHVLADKTELQPTAQASVTAERVVN